MNANINYGEIEKFRAVVVLRFLESEATDGEDVEEDQRNFICNSIPFPFNLYAVYMRFGMTHESSIKMTCSSWQTNRLRMSMALELTLTPANAIELAIGEMKCAWFKDICHFGQEWTKFN